MATKSKNKDDGPQPAPNPQPAPGPQQIQKTIKGVPLTLLMFFLLSLALLVLIQEGFQPAPTPYDNIKNYSSIYDELVRYAKNLNRYYLYYGGDGFAQLNDDQKVSADEIKQKKSDLETSYEADALRLTDKFMESVKAQNSLSNPVVGDSANSLTSQLSQALQALNQDYTYTDDQIRQMIVQEKDDNYLEIKSYLTTNLSFRYYLLNRQTNQRFTNYGGAVRLSTRPDGNLTFSPEPGDNGDQDILITIPLDDQIFFENTFNGIPLAESFKMQGWTGCILIPALQPSGTNLGYTLQRAMSFPAYQYPGSLAGWGCLLPALIILGYLTVRRLLGPSLRAVYGLYRRYPLTVKLIVLYLSCVIILFNTADMGRITTSVLIDHEVWQPLFYALVYTLALGHILLGVFHIAYVLVSPRRIAAEPELRALAAYRRHAVYVFRCESRTAKALFMIVSLLLALNVLGGLTGFLVLLMQDFLRNLPLIAALTAVCVLLVWLGVGVLNLVMHYAKLTCYLETIAGGDFNSLPDLPPETGQFAESVRMLNDLKTGVSATVEDMLKSERMKAELITNVSHDLKTPLTSIINYVDLLKQLPGQSQQALEYTEVLDKKSMRLKLLIDDLFEAAKLSSGSLELSPERVNIVDLLQQALGELSEKIEEAGVQFRFAASPEKIYMMVDGRKMWRVFENLLNNIIKYAQRDSRAFITAEAGPDGAVTIQFKNVSAYEMEFRGSDLFERFTRGDASRSTEGSGLGLSIAKSIVELSGGAMEIVIDGDLFKVVMSFSGGAVSG